MRIPNYPQPLVAGLELDGEAISGIRSELTNCELDGTWHRPFSTLEPTALRSVIGPEEMFDLDGDSNTAKRKRIGNAAPSYAAQAIADMMGVTLLLARARETFVLSAQPMCCDR